VFKLAFNQKAENFMLL